MKGGFHPLSRAAGLVDEGVVHEWTGIQQYEPADRRRDAIVQRQFDRQRRLLAKHPELIQLIDRDEQAYWTADRLADDSVVGHTLEGVELLEELGGLLAHGTS